MRTPRVGWRRGREEVERREDRGMMSVGWEGRCASVLCGTE